MHRTVTVPSVRELTVRCSTAKAKRHGWFGSVDSIESILSVVDEFAALKIIPAPSSIGGSD